MKKVNRIFVLSTAVLSFISFWRAAAIVITDFGSSAYYAGGIAAKYYGPAFPYFILMVMLLAGLLLMTYIESASLFTRGGVYVVVKNAFGRPFAKLGVSSLILDYLLTGPISAVSAGLYLAYLLEILLPYSIFTNFSNRFLAIIFSLIVIFYFWYENIKGVKESSSKNVKIVLFTSFVGFLLIIFSLYTLFKKGVKLPPFEMHFTETSLGWLKDIDFIKPIGIIGIIIAFSHSILALSGLETLAQVFREIEDPKIKNLKKSVFIIFLFGIFFTGFLTFLSSLIIPHDKIISEYSENLLSGLCMELSIPYGFRIIMKILVVISALLMLVGAVNTSMVGANGILNRVSEDGILPDKIRKLHPKYGTTYIIITIVAIMQAVVVILSGGNIFILGEAYAFGVLWSLTLDLLSLIALRIKKFGEREWKFPINIEIGKYEIPLGLIFLFIIVFTLAFTNLFTKKIATISGISFSVLLYVIFTYFERKHNEDLFDIHNMDEEIDDEKVNITTENELNKIFEKLTKQNKVLVPVRNPENLSHLKYVLENFNDDETDIVVIYVKVEKGYEIAFNYDKLTTEEKELFKNVILMAEKYGKTINPVIIFSNDPSYVIINTAISGGFNRICMGVSGTLGAEAQLENIAIEWGFLKPSNFNSKIEVNIIWDSRMLSYNLT